MPRRQDRSPGGSGKPPTGPERGPEEAAAEATGGLKLGGLFKGLGNFIELLGDLAEKGAALEKQVGPSEKGGGKGVQAVYGFSMRVGGVGAPARLESFGNVRPGRRGGEAMIEHTREPIIDVLEEDGGVRVVAELPGVEEGDVKYDLEEDAVTFRAKHGDRRYEKHVDLPAKVLKEGARQSFRNGIFELRLKSADERAGG